MPLIRYSRYSRYSRFALPALLFLLLSVEWLLPNASQPPTLRPPAIPAAEANAASDDQIVYWASTVLARPLLAPDRRPERQVVAEVSDTLPRLSAIISIGGNRDAIFADAGEKPQLVGEGDEISGYRVKTVAPDSVELIGPDGLTTLRPQFANAATASPSQ